MFYKVFITTFLILMSGSIAYTQGELGDRSIDVSRPPIPRPVSASSGQCTPAQIQENRTVINRCNSNWSNWGIDPPSANEIRQPDDCAGVLSTETLLSCGDAIMALPIFFGELAVLGISSTFPVDRNSFMYVSQNGSLEEIEAFLAGEFMKEQCGLFPWAVNTYPAQECPNRESHLDQEAHQECRQRAVLRVQEFNTCRRSAEVRALYRERRPALVSRARQIKAEQDRRRALEERHASEINRIKSTCRSQMRQLQPSAMMLLSPQTHLVGALTNAVQPIVAPTEAQVQAYTSCVSRETESNPELRDELINAADGLMAQISRSFSSIKCYNGRIRKALACEVALAVLTGRGVLSLATTRRLGPEAESAMTRLSRNAATEERDNQVGVIYYPRRYHVDIEVDGQVHNAVSIPFVNSASSSPAAMRPRSAEALQRVARSGRVSYYKATVAMTDTEMDILRTQLNSQSRGFQTCIGGTCRMLSDAAGETVVPFPLNQTPALSNLYMNIMSRVGSSRIVSMEYVGQRQLSDRIAAGTMNTLEGMYIGAFAGQSGYIIYTTINNLGREETHVVPLRD